MLSPKARRLVLPATLAVSTFVSAQACNGPLGGPDYCIDINSTDKCNKAEGCRWNEMFSECQNICYEIETQEECEALSRCAWYPDGAFDSEADTGTGGDPAECGEPFT